MNEVRPKMKGKKKVSNPKPATNMSESFLTGMGLKSGRMRAENPFFFKEPSGWMGRTTCYDCSSAMGGCTQAGVSTLK